MVVEGIIILGFAIIRVVEQKRRQKRRIAIHNAKNREAFHLMNENFFSKGVKDSLLHIVQSIREKYPNIEIKTELKNNTVPLMIPLAQLENIVINLLKNAVEALPEGGKIDIKTQSCSGRFEFRIRDNGKGIPEKIKKKIFKMGYSDKKEKNHGMGLYFVKKEIEKAKGKIVLEEDSEYTTFKITIPQRRIEAVVIEDEPVLRQILVTILKKAGFLVTGFQRIEQIDYQNVDALYLDIMLWNKNSLSEYKKIRERYPNLVIIFMSASQEHKALSNILKTDKRTEILLKPYHESEPVDKLIKLLAKN